MHELGRFPDARHTKTHVFSLCGKSRPSEQFWDTRPVGTCHPVFIFRSVETDVVNAVGEPESQGSGQLRKVVFLCGASRPQEALCLPQPARCACKKPTHQSQQQAAWNGPTLHQKPPGSCSPSNWPKCQVAANVPSGHSCSFCSWRRLSVAWVVDLPDLCTFYPSSFAFLNWIFWAWSDRKLLWAEPRAFLPHLTQELYYWTTPQS